MSQPSAYEQLFLELVNRSRLDPAAEAQRLGIGLNDNLAAGTINADSKAPLAWNPLLGDSSATHSQWMLAADVFSHTGNGGTDPGARMRAAGYEFSGSWTSGENIAWNGSSAGIDTLAGVRSAHDGLFKSSGHRTNLLNAGFREVGIGVETGKFTSGGSEWNALMATQNFATSGASRFVTGVVYNDNDHDSFYSVGEGSNGVQVQVSGVSSAATGTAGGYAAAFGTSGVATVAFSGGSLPNPTSVKVTLGAENIKLDLVDGTTVQSSASATLVSGAPNLKLLGVANLSATGNALANTLTGNRSANILNGGAGADTLNGGAGADTMIGGLGNDFYVVDAATDVVTETSILATEIDRVNSSISYVLGANVEQLVLTGTAAINSTGNTLANALTGNAAANILNGGAGSDTMVGGAGNDTYYVDNAGDRVTETSTLATEIDRVNSSISYALGANVEQLVLTGTAAINGTGNTLANRLTGNAAANILSGAAGNDILSGGAGKDSLSGGAGLDTLTGFSGIAANGATEIDTLTGGTEADRFVLGNSTMRFYDDALTTNAGRAGYALITDFTAGQDKLQLKGTTANYYLGASGVAGVTGSGLFFEQGATDELIAIVRSGNTTALTAVNTINTAVFV